MAEKRDKSYWQRYYKKNKGIIERKKKIYYAENKERILIRSKLEKWSLKKEVLTHYGNGKLACVKCGFNDIRALTIDHISGGGNAHRRQLSTGKQGGANFYRWLRQNNYPRGYQVLCMNCQFISQVKTLISTLNNL